MAGSQTEVYAGETFAELARACPSYTSDAADEYSCRADDTPLTASQTSAATYAIDFEEPSSASKLITGVESPSANLYKSPY